MGLASLNTSAFLAYGHHLTRHRSKAAGKYYPSAGSIRLSRQSRLTTLRLDQHITSRNTGRSYPVGHRQILHRYRRHQTQIVSVDNPVPGGYQPIQSGSIYRSWQDGYRQIRFRLKASASSFSRSIIRDLADTFRDSRITNRYSPVGCHLILHRRKSGRCRSCRWIIRRSVATSRYSRNTLPLWEHGFRLIRRRSRAAGNQVRHGNSTHRLPRSRSITHHLGRHITSRRH